MADVRRRRAMAALASTLITGNTMTFDPLQFELRHERRAAREAAFGRLVPAGKFGVVIANVESVNSEDIAKLAARHCLLLLGCRPADTLHGDRLIVACGFSYRTNFCQYWNAPGDSDGYVRSRHLLWLLATKGKGKIPAPAPGTQWPSSAKSDDSALINSFVRQFFPSVPMIDLREAAP